MSFRHPSTLSRRRSSARPSYTRENDPSSPSPASTSSHNPSASATLIDVTRFPRQRRPRYSGDIFLPGPEVLVVLPARTRLTQVYNLDDFNDQSPRRQGASSAGDPFFDNTFTFPTVDADVNGHRRKEKQWMRWTTEVIPSLLRPYLQLLRKTENFRFKPDDNTSSCTCSSPSRPMDVIGVYFNCLVSIRLCPCACTPLPVKLLARGLFPCSPIKPSLAVDITFLQFVREVFLCFAPNITAISDALEAFLAFRGYKPNTKGSLRRRFGKALQWYTVLHNLSTSSVQQQVEDARADALKSNGASSSAHRGELRRPSEYLRARCPLCFGGSLTRDLSSKVDVIVCLDACFTQKRRKAPQGRVDQDEPLQHPDTFFLSDDEVKEMETYMNDRRSCQRHTVVSVDDGFDGPLKVPNSVLNECNASFTAADEKHQKASTQLFADTGLMALLCRHDRVLWLVNMTSPGEKQHYAVALLRRLFQNLPTNMIVGALYDIGCQLDRSFVKWDLLPEFRDRLVFALSIFHAYGHQWPCQVIYHPRKCIGFGLSDGEGCERFWSSIRKLIPNLRVSGYHQRLFQIDTQVKHLEKVSMNGLAHWLSRKWYSCIERKNSAADNLAQLGSEDYLRTQWEDQVKAQTAPLPRRSQNTVNQTIDAILALEKRLKEGQDRTNDLERELADADETSDVLAISVELTQCQESTKRLSDLIRVKRNSLGMSEKSRLRQLKGNEFLREQLNARAIKTRLRDRLRQRKFELERLERSYRQTLNDKKLSTQTESAIKRREPGIAQLAKSYNELCQKLNTLNQQGRAPRNSVLPQPIKTKGLFVLDVDDEIWQEIGLDGERDEPAPAWLTDQSVRDGIKLCLEFDRCQEEEMRLRRERTAMQEWVREEWACLAVAEATHAHDADVLFQLHARRDTLLQLCSIWQADARPVPTNKTLGPSWGPTEEELQDAATRAVTGSWDESESSGTWWTSFGGAESDSDGAALEDLDGDNDLLDAVELADFLDAHHMDM